MKRAELISTGSELLSGRTVNTHAQRLGAALHALGIALLRDTTVPDAVGEIRDAVAAALQRADLVFVCGGLGPTEDDLTRDALAALLGCGIHRDPAALERIRQISELSGRPFTDIRASQAAVLDGSVVLSNQVGAAPGMRVDLGADRALFVLPGPPDEFAAVLEDHILPWLAAHPQWRSPYLERMFLLCGVAEADAMERMRLQHIASGGIDAAYCAAPGRLEVRLSSAKGDAEALDAAADRFRRLMGPMIYAEARRPLEEVAGEALAAAGATVAVAESCTGGGLGARITAVPGSTAWFVGGVIAYANVVKEQWLGVDPALLAAEGAVSAPVASAMAEGIRHRMGADYGVGITGVAGPSGQTASKPLGLVYIALAGEDGVTVQRYQFRGDRGMVRHMAGQMALDLVRRRVLGLEAP